MSDQKRTSKQPEDWTIAEVASWLSTTALSSLSSSKWAAVFREQEICGKALSMIDLQDLKHLGMAETQAIELLTKINALFPPAKAQVAAISEPPHKRCHSQKQAAVDHIRDVMLHDIDVILASGECLH